MEGLSNMYSQHYAAMDPQAALDGYTQDGVGGMGSNRSMDAPMLDSTQSQTLDQIINQNNQELMRRRGTIARQPIQHFQSNAGRDHNRRASMLEFSSTVDGDLANFQFDPNPTRGSISRHVGGMMPKNGLEPRRVRSGEDLALDTQFGIVGQGLDAMNTSPAFNAPSLIQSTSLSSDPSSYMGGGMDFDTINTDVANLNMHPNSAQQAMFATSPLAQTFPMAYPSSNADPVGSAGTTPHSASQMMAMSQSSGSTPQKMMTKSQSLRRNPMMPSPLSVSQTTPMGSMTSPVRPQATNSRRQSIEMPSGYSQHNPSDPMVQGPTPASYGRYSSAYSSSGFDMLGVLMRVATRQKPEINIGPVDLSCAFVVCDIEKHDVPIVYCSDMFERLTGYSKYEILGRNCRFLQAPDGKVQSGVKRKYVDDKSVLYLKNQITRRAEAQLSLINYRKGGQPFMNLLTMIPIPWNGEEHRYFVGFQVDLVEQPNSVSAKNPDGTYEINYNRSSLPAYQLPQSDHASVLHESGQTISREEVSHVLSTIGNGETELSKRIWDKVLLENTDDVVHVLSLKGLFLYLSPACRKVLEYDPSELVGTPLSSVCHPSDIVPVTRELSTLR